MDDGYGLYGIDDPKVLEALADLPKPASNDPKDLAIAACKRGRGTGHRGRQDARPDGAAADNNTQTGAVHAAGQSSDSGGSNSTAIVLIVGRLGRPAGRAGGPLLVGAPRPRGRRRARPS